MSKLRFLKIFLFVLILPVFTSCSHPAAQLEYKVISTYKHDGTAYTEGLELEGPKTLFESTGQYGESTVRKVERGTGKILHSRPLAKDVFGEGLTVLNHKTWVLTWKENNAYVLEPGTFKYLRKFSYKGEGWGLTNDGKNLIMSDGSSELKFINPKDFSVIRTITAKDGHTSIRNLNELEWINGQIYANVYMTDRIVRISPTDGRVTGWLNLSGLRQQLTSPNRAEVLNGIAFDKASGNLIITGKYWPEMFEIQVSEK
jgi:glutamine cyclotransferase